MTAPKITRRRIKIALGLVLTVGATGIAFAALSGSPDSPGENYLHPVPVELRRVKFCTEYTVRRTFSGQVATARASNLGFESPGKIALLLADEGDVVELGEELARQDTRKLDARRRRVAAELAQAQAALKEARNGERKQTIRGAKFRVTELEVELKLAESELRRMRKARALQSVTPSELDSALAARDGVRARLEIARSRLSELNEGIRSERIAIRAAMVDSLAASLDEIDAQLEDAVLVAPFAGTIARRFVDDGEVVAGGRTIFRLVESSRLEARVGLTPRVAKPLQIGQTVDVRIDETRGTATLTALLPELDPQTRTRTAVFSLDAGIASQAVVGEVVEVVIPRVVYGRGYWLPTSALVRGIRGMWSCFAAVPLKGRAAKGGTASLYRIERRDLEALFVEGDRVYVRGTIRDSDEIVVTGTHRVVANQIVQRRRAGSVSDRRSPGADAHRLADEPLPSAPRSSAKVPEHRISDKAAP